VYKVLRAQQPGFQYIIAFLFYDNVLPCIFSFVIIVAFFVVILLIVTFLLQSVRWRFSRVLKDLFVTLRDLTHEATCAYLVRNFFHLTFWGASKRKSTTHHHVE